MSKKKLRRGARRVTVLPLRVGDVAMPASLSDVKWLQLDSDALPLCAVQVVKDASRHLAAATAPTAPLAAGAVRRSSRDWTGPARVASDDEPVQIVAVDTERIGRPRNDGTRGSGLYRVPLLLSRVPPAVGRLASLTLGTRRQRGRRCTGRASRRCRVTGSCWMARPSTS